MFRLCLLLLFLLASSSSWSAETTALNDVTEKLSYSSGYRLGEYYRRQRLDMNADLVMKGLQDGKRGVRPALPKGEMRAILLDPKTALAKERELKRDARLSEEQVFLNSNAQNEDVIVLPSGLQYKVLNSGEGVRPQLGNTVKIRYRGSRIDGRGFDSSPEDGSPAEMAVDQLIPGMAEGLQLMQEGATWILYIPAALAFGDRGPMANQAVVFELELVEVVSSSSSSD